MIAIGANLDKAMWLAVELETIARQYYLSLAIGGPVLLPDAEIAHVMEGFKSYGPRGKDCPPPGRSPRARRRLDPTGMVSAPQSVDLLVIGGGINGVGIARDAAGRGLSVVLCERDDLASGTSSRSGKLIHGGLRYLEYYDLRLVREALIEREVLLAAAPHIVWPMRFVLPHSPEQRPAWLIRLGLFLYDHLGGRKRLAATRALDLRTAPEGAPLRKTFGKAFEYSDCWVDDARLVVLNALDAAKHGADDPDPHRMRPRAARATAAGRSELLCRESGERRTVDARALVNAAGPWVEQVLGRVAGANSRAGPPGEGQPHRHQEILGRPAGLSVAEHGQARDLRQPL